MSIIQNNNFDTSHQN